MTTRLPWRVQGSTDSNVAESCVRMRAYVCVCVRMCAHVCVCVRMCACVCACVRMCVVVIVVCFLCVYPTACGIVPTP